MLGLLQLHRRELKPGVLNSARLQRLGRALVLMALGAVIIGAMLWFNIKREAILQRIRVFRADLAE